MSDATLTRDDNLFGYREKVRGFPMLSEPEKRDLARRWRADRAPRRWCALAGSHLRMVVPNEREHVASLTPVLVRDGLGPWLWPILTWRQT